MYYKIIIIGVLIFTLVLIFLTTRKTTRKTTTKDCIWSEWSVCTKPCGPAGIRSRTRPTEGLSCPSLTEEQPCNRVSCPGDCVVGDWNQWSTCSETCGSTGIRSRTRPILFDSQNGGLSCPSLTEEQPCNRVICPVDCVVGDWNNWTTCNVPCGTGIRSRTRTIITQPTGGGLSCPSTNEQENCSTDCKSTSWTRTGTISSPSASPGSCEYGQGEFAKRYVIIVNGIGFSGNIRQISISAFVKFETEGASGTPEYGAYIDRNGQLIDIGGTSRLLENIETSRIFTTDGNNLAFVSTDRIGIFIRNGDCNGGTVRNPIITLYYT